MRYAIGFPIAGPLGGDPRSVAELSWTAEQAGWDAVLLEDYLVHHIAPGAVAVSDPWIALAAAAVKTTRIKLGLTVVALPRRRPWKVAREAVSLDYLSGGRMILGVGIGDINDHGFARVGEETDAKKRGTMLQPWTSTVTSRSWGWRGRRSILAVKFIRPAGSNVSQARANPSSFRSALRRSVSRGTLLPLISTATRASDWGWS